jgi:osmotically inducible protein OsmC
MSMATERSAQATWQGDLIHGSGEIHEAPSGAFGPLQVSWAARSEEQHGGQTSPEELIAAAHTACFAMALSNVLAKADHAPERLETSATVTFVPGMDEAAFKNAAEEAKTGCPVSGALEGNVELTVDARLQN